MSEQNTRKTRSGGDVSEKIFNTRIVHKHDTEANWNKAINFIPKAGELIIYDPDENYVYSRIKIGDGVTIVTNLPFIKAEAIDVPEVNVDGTLSIEGAAADAKAVGDAFDALGILSTKDSVSKSDLASDVQTSLSKADTALQSFTETDPTVPGWAKEATKPTYTASEVGADPTGTASSVASSHNTSTESHNDIRLLIEGLTSRLNTIADSDDTTLDQMSEIVYYIKSNKSLIDSITTSKVNVSDIINNLTTNVSNKPLSAAQGVALKALIDAITVPTKVSELTNDKGYITGYTETDPTVPAWAKASTKPSYTASEIGLATETWTFTLEDGSTVTKAVYVG